MTTTSYSAAMPAGRHVGTFPIKVQNKINFATQNEAASQVVQCLSIPAKAFVTKVILRIDTIEDSALTCTIGDGTNTSGWDATACDLTAAVNTCYISIEGTDTYGLGKYYAAADTIDIALSANAANTGIITLAAIYYIIE